MTDLLFCSNDLMFTSQVSRAAANHQILYRAVTSVEQLQQLPADELGTVRLVILDLANVAADPVPWVQAVRHNASQAKVLAYGPHVERDQLDQARQAGCDDVLTRGQFHQQLTERIAQLSRA